MARIPLLPETRAVRALSLIAMSLMVAIATLALAGVAAFRHIDQDWRHALTDRWTLELPAPDTQRPIIQADIERIVKLLEGVSGIEKVRPIGPQEIRRLLQPWMDDTASMAELPLPILIDIEIDKNNPPSIEKVSQKLASANVMAKLDDQHSWTSGLITIAQTGELLGLALFTAIMLSATLTVAVTARARLTINRSEIELLHVIGASDFYIARQFQTGAFISSLSGAAVGLVIAGAIIFALNRLGSLYAPLIPKLQLEAVDWALLAFVPICAVLIATLVTRMTASALLRRLL